MVGGGDPFYLKLSVIWLR